MRKKRTDIELMIAILNVCKNKDVNLTKIIMRAELGYSSTRLLDIMEKRGLLKKKEIVKQKKGSRLSNKGKGYKRIYYRTTKKGLNLLKLWKRFVKELGGLNW